MDDFHRTTTQNIGGTHHQGQAELLHDQAALFNRIGNTVFRLAQAQFIEKALEAVAVFRQIDGIGRGAQNRNSGTFKGFGQFERCLAAELHNYPFQSAVFLFFGENFQNIFSRQRFKIKAVRCVIIGRNGFGIAIDHDGFITGFGQRETGMAAAIIKFDPLTDPVGAPPQNHHFVAVGWLGLIGQTSGKGGCIG